MRKNSRVIEISGISGLFILLFSAVCLFVGFVVFPGYLAMNLWNIAGSEISGFPMLSLYQGVLLWIIVALGIFILGNCKSPIAFKSATKLNEREISALMNQIKKSKNVRTIVLNKDEINNSDIFKKLESEDIEQKKDKENL